MLREIIAFAVAAAATALATPLAIWLAPKIGAMDIPKDNRRMHSKPIPRFGGIAIYCGILVGFRILWPLDGQLLGVFIGGTLILILGIVDDLANLSAKVKLAGQIVCALVLWYFTIRIGGMANFLPIGPEYIFFPVWLSIIVTCGWIVLITNTINLIDGLDGLAAGVTCIACLAVAYVANYTGREQTEIMMLAIAGATFGFLFFNFHPAKIFMGDAGSMLLGFLLAAVSLIGDAPTKSITLFATTIPIIILALPLFDTLFAIVRRAYNHKPIMQADKGHIHHRFMAKGFGQRRTASALYSVSAIMGIAGVLWTVKLKVEAVILTFIVALLMYTLIGNDEPGHKDDRNAAEASGSGEAAEGKKEGQEEK